MYVGTQDGDLTYDNQQKFDEFESKSYPLHILS